MDHRTFLIVHIAVPEAFRIFRIIRAVTSFAAVVEQHDRPAVVDIFLMDTRHPHPAMDIQKSGGVLDTSLDTVYAVDTDFLSQYVCADVGLPVKDPILSFLLDDLLLEITLVRIVVFPDRRRLEQLPCPRKLRSHNYGEHSLDQPCSHIHLLRMWIGNRPPLDIRPTLQPPIIPTRNTVSQKSSGS